MRIKFLSMVLIFCLVPAAFAEPAANAPELKNEFMDLYQFEWKSSNFNYDLFRIIDKEFDEITGKMLFGTKGLQLAINKHNVIEKILADISSRFQPEYELFFKIFYDKYYTLLDANPDKYSHEKIKDLLFYEKVASVQSDVWKKKLDKIGTMFEKRISLPYFAIILFAAGLLILLFRGLATKNLPTIAHRKERRIKVIVGFAGVTIIILGIFQISRWFFFAQGVTREFIYEQTKNLYVSELPQTVWTFIEPYVQGALN